MNPLLIRRRGMMQAAAAPPQDGQLEWIETDGIAYIASGINATPAKSFEMKVLARQGAIANRVFVGTLRTGVTGSNFFALGLSNSQTSANFGYYYYYGQSDGNPSISSSLQNETPFEVRTKLAAGSQFIEVKQEGESTFTRNSKTQSSTPATSGYYMRIFQANPGTFPCINGDRIYYLKIYGDGNFSSLVRNYLPWRLNGEVGLMDTLTNTFYGNAAGSGAFTGGPNVI